MTRGRELSTSCFGRGCWQASTGCHGPWYPIEPIPWVNYDSRKSFLTACSKVLAMVSFSFIVTLHPKHWCWMHGLSYFLFLTSIIDWIATQGSPLMHWSEFLTHSWAAIVGLAKLTNPDADSRGFRTQVWPHSMQVFSKGPPCLPHLRTFHQSFL